MPPPPFSPSLISFTVSVDVKHNVYLLTHLFGNNTLVTCVHRAVNRTVTLRASLSGTFLQTARMREREREFVLNVLGCLETY